MPHVNSVAKVLVRDGFMCRYCGHRLYLSQAIKLFDVVVPDLELYDNNGKKEPLRSWWATVDHIKPLNKGGTDCLDNLLACCVRCNSRLGDGERPICGPCEPSDWWGYADYFLALAPSHGAVLNGRDRCWIKALEWAGVAPTADDPIAAVRALRVELATESDLSTTMSL